ncbi:MAG TPA: 3'(2'),5'-bisphosphate nucleotidase CysQ [Acidimicrobiaceae bacterium]|nr:3'(2'),5'-bisphosphate nucleotidase CysQ [Acidimicrobiaceae bacterium]HCB37790.1 3'(2'),5'-bisphosphate nucleotidase CysQ [Acidimicrobiaceae bacterium]
MADAHDHALAAEVATRAGALLVELRERMFSDGAAGWAVGDAGDAAAHELIVSALAAARPDDGLLSEEGHDDPARLEAARVWIVDPLDGTREYSVPGRKDWAVHVALVEDGSPTAGAVALPAIGATLATQPAPPPPPAHDGKPRLAVSRTRTTPAAQIVAHALDADIVRLGSAGAKAMAVVLGHAEAYAHSGGQYEWDSCAPVAVARAAGLHTSRLDGSELDYNYADPWLPDLLICRPELAERALAALARAIAGGPAPAEKVPWS